MIEYKGYIGVVDFDPEIDLFHGTVKYTGRNHILWCLCN